MRGAHLVVVFLEQFKAAFHSATVHGEIVELSAV
jgi:hypothetical protein